MISVGLKYINFLILFSNPNKSDFNQEAEQLFSPNIKKIVNSRTICNNRSELIQQMQDVKQKHGISNINLLENITSKDKNADVIRWEIKYNDNSIESVITILKFDQNGLISEINEVFGEKEIYQWQTKN